MSFVLSARTDIDSYIFKDFGVDPIPNVYFSLQAWFPTALSDWLLAHNGQISGQFLSVITNGLLLATPGADFAWCKEKSSIVALTTSHLEPETWHQLEIHFDAAGGQARIDGDEFALDTNDHSADNYVISIGQFDNDNLSFVGDPIYVTCVTVGTTDWGSSDLFADKFDSGDYSLWDGDSGAGAPSVITNPTGIDPCAVVGSKIRFQFGVH